MKIIIGSESFAPNISGVATATELLAKSLSKQGHKVFVFAPSKSTKTYEDKSFKEFRVIRFRSMPNPFRRGFRVGLLPGKDISRYFETIKPDLVHLQDPNSISTGLLKSATKNNVPIVITNHFSLEYVISYVKYLRPIHKQLKMFLRHHLSSFYNKCDYVTCPTETVKKDLLSWGVKVPIVAISNGVDLDKFFVYLNVADVLKKYHIPQNPTVLYVGRVDKDKKIEVLIDVIPKVLKEVNAHFVIIGSGDEVLRMKKKTQKLQVDYAISWVGWLDKNSEDFVQLYQDAKVFAIPSTIETQSIVTMEAMAAGLPIVGANAGALPELIIDGKNGYLARPDDVDDFAKKIIKILKDNNLQKNMSKKSLELVSKHQISTSINKIMKIYEEILKTNK